MKSEPDLPFCCTHASAFAGTGSSFRGPLLLIILSCWGTAQSGFGQADVRESMAGPSGADALRKKIAAEEYNLQYGPVRFQTEARLGGGYTDNVFYSDNNRQHDWVVNPEVNLKAWMPVSQLNVLRLSLGLGYEWYADHHVLNSDRPLVSPDTELDFHIFVGDFRIRLRERFSYEESLFINSAAGESAHFFNFNNVGKFARLDNLAGGTVDWDLNKVILSAGYDHENFKAFTDQFKYLNRASELMSASANVLLGDKAKTGVEGQASWNDYDTETVLNDHWRATAGPFAEMAFRGGISVRGGGGYATAKYDAAARDSDYNTYYAYGRIRQDTRLFTHSVTAGRETVLGDNANNLRSTYVRYSIVSPAVAHVELGASFTVNFAKEFGGPFHEDFTYYRPGAHIGYQFAKYWRTDLAYEYFMKDSDLALRDFKRNRVSWDVTFQF
jgi:hypothetical protein